MTHTYISTKFWHVDELTSCVPSSGLAVDEKHGPAADLVMERSGSCAAQVRVTMGVIASSHGT